ncbi:ABC transporter substrate-binding protein [uncultured Brevibacillus sp.]|uniref:ABC transporter substrate-binding protein n=1 Tax=uncultured Brevibacillus sp. TaxID=169970 RepID=UPI002591EC3E|nr:ABC transporter substrate-binding protein [uncultured Brevibacillus sp.]
MLRARLDRPIKYLLFTCLLAFTAAGCTSSPPPAPGDQQSKPSASLTPKMGGTITIGYQAEPDTLDPQKTALSAGNFVGSLLGGGLVVQDPYTLELKPHLAESYTISEDGKIWTFKLRQGVKFHDGTPLTASSFKQSMERAMDPKTASPLSGQELSAIKAISAPDDSTLILQLSQPSAPLLSALSYGGYQQPVAMEALKKYGTDFGRNPVGVGPWKFESWKTGESITLTRNEDYQWAAPFVENQGHVRPDKLVIKFIKDNQTLMAALDSGTIDIANVPAKDVNKYKDDKDFTVLEGMQPVENFIGMNLQNEILQDINVRKALNLAINKEALIIADLQGEGVPVYGPIPPTMVGYDPAVEQYGYKYNKEEAMRLLEEAGWKIGGQGIREKNGKELSLLMIIDNPKPGNQLVQSMLKEIGVDLKLQSYEMATASEQAVKGAFDLLATDHGSNDPHILDLLFNSNQIGGLNFFRISNKELDSLLEKGATITDSGERQKVYADIQKLVVDEAYWVPLYSAKTFQVIHNRIQGVKPNPLATLNVQDMWVNE